MQQPNRSLQPFALGARSKAVLVTGFIALSLLATPWFNLPYSGLNWAAAGQPYEPTQTPVATVPSITTRTPTSAAATTTPTVTLTPATPETRYAYMPLVRRDPPPPPTLTPTPLPTATPTQTPIPVPSDGTWWGDTSHPQGYVHFDVSDGGTRWSRFIIGFPECRMELVLRTEGSITNNRFDFTSHEFSFSGRFTADTEASGDYAVAFEQCSESGTWTASWTWPPFDQNDHMAHPAGGRDAAAAVRTK